MKYATICSGINAPACAWNSLGWEEQFCAEIEPFPCSVLAHHYPTVPNLGDITKYETWPDFGIDLLCGGTPCQSFSLAGLRKGMDDPRGQLTRAFIGIAAMYHPRWLLWENVPGVLSADGGEAFAGFLAGLTGRKITMPAEGWGNFGVVAGIPEAYGLAWRVLDTQFVRVDSHPRACPQRRERVFVVGHLGGCWQRAAAVLLERESLLGHPAPRRQPGQGSSYSTAPSLTSSGRGVERAGESRGQDPVVPVAPPVVGTFQETGHGWWNDDPVAQTIRDASAGGGSHSNIVAHTLKGEGHDASEDGTGRGVPIVPAVCGALSDGALSDGAHNGGGLNGQDAYTGRILPICFTAKDYGQDAKEEVSPTLRSGNEDGGNANGGVMPAVAIQDAQGMDKAQNGAGINADGAAYTADTTGSQGVAHGFQPRIARNGYGNFEEGVVHALQASSTGKSDAAPCVATKTAVRRLTPTECARLQGFPDTYLNVQHRKKPAADGPKYRALGNSMSVNVMRWLGQRIQIVDHLSQ